MHDWKNILLPTTATMADVIQVLDKEALRIALIVDQNNKLLGTVTDGDIRRALIQHLGMETCVAEIMQKKPTVASLEDDSEAIMTIMKRAHLLQIPILDHCGVVVGLETIQQLIDTNSYDNTVVLMAGGYGKRLRPLTHETPKSLLKVGNKPILETIIERFISSGFHNFYISIHYKADMIQDYFGNGEQWGVNIRYLYEDKPLGTAGALGLLPDDLPDLPIILMNSDLLTKVNFERLLNFHSEQACMATMCVREYDFQVPYGVIQADGHNVNSIVEKPVHRFFVNAGIYVLDLSLLNSVSKNTYLDMPTLLEQNIQRNTQVTMFPIHEYWLDIGRMEEYQQAQNDLCQHSNNS